MGRLSDARKKARSAKAKEEKAKSGASDAAPAGEGDSLESASQTSAQAGEASSGEPKKRKAAKKSAAPSKSARRKKSAAGKGRTEPETSTGGQAPTATPEGAGEEIEQAALGEPIAADGRDPEATFADLRAEDLAAEAPAATQAGESEFEGIFADEPAAPDKPPAKTALPASGLADDILGAGAPEPKEAATGGGGLPGSGLADDILSGTDPDMAKAPEEPAPSGETRDSDEDASSPDDWAGLLDTLKEDEVPRALPSSGLAEDILQGAKRSAERTRLGLDEIHEFENFFEEEEQAEQMHLVLFGMDDEVFALEMDRVQEIIRVPAITRVPHVEDYIRGVCNLRGRIVPVFDLRKMMGLQPKSIDRMNRIMVLDLRGKQVGMLIDRASEVARVDLSDIEPPPEEMRAIDRNLVTAVARSADRMIFILDVDRVMALH